MPGRAKRVDSRHAPASRHLAKELRKARTGRGLTQQRLAALADVSIGTVRKIEDNSVVEPGLFTILALARALDYDLISFIDGWNS